MEVELKDESNVKITFTANKKYGKTDVNLTDRSFGFYGKQWDV